MQPTKYQAKQAIFDNLPFVVESQKYSQSRFDAIKAKCEAINIAHSKINELQPIVKDYVKTFLNCKVANATGGFFHKFEKGLPALPKWGETENKINAYYHKSFGNIMLKLSANVSYETTNYREENTTEHLRYECYLYLCEFDGSGNLTRLYDDRKDFGLYDFEQVKQQLIRIDQLHRFLSSQESVLGCSYLFQNML
jgi:hypothetical protein